MAASEADIARDSAAILQNSRAMVETILARRAELDREGKYDQPLIVVSGQSSVMPAHAIHLIAILDGLKDKDRVALCYEFAHDAIQDAFAKASGAAPGAQQADYLREQDKTGALSARYNFGLQQGYAHKALLSFVAEQNIPLRLTDAVTQGPDFYSRAFDAGDPSTAASLRACFNGTAPPALDPEMPEGFRVRNHHMAAQSLDLARATKARIVVQLCGNFHVMGRGDNYPARDSVAANIKALGAPVLAMPRLGTYFPEAGLPANHGLSAQETLLVKGLPETMADMNSSPDGWTESAAYATALLKHCGMGAVPLTNEKFTELEQQYARDVAQVFAACRQTVGNKPVTP